MTKERLKQTILLNLKRGTRKRAEYLKSIFYEVGERVAYQPRIIPLYPQLIKLHNNIMIASNVRFVTHDAIHHVLNGCEKYPGGGVYVS